MVPTALEALAGQCKDKLPPELTEQTQTALGGVQGVLGGLFSQLAGPFGK